jgi:hypothetical protein
MHSEFGGLWLTDNLGQHGSKPLRQVDGTSDLSRPEVEGRWPAVVTDPDTGGRKGSKLARFDMIPPDVLWELAEHYGKGEAIYPSDPDPNWQRGYSWRLSVAALHRHLSLWESGEDTDAETGSSHLIAATWHCVALRYFQLHGKGTDYRETKP